VSLILRLGPLKTSKVGPATHPFASFLQAAETGKDIGPFLEKFTRGFGFDTFSYWMAHPPCEGHETQTFLVTTEDTDWLRLYDARAYVEVDPRVNGLLQTTLPSVWDQRTFSSESPEIGEFLATAGGYGIASGVVVPLRDRFGHSGMMALNAGIANPDGERQRRVMNSLGDIALFGRYFQEVLNAAIGQRQFAPSTRFLSLSVRERECLFLASNGLSFSDVAATLRVPPNILQFHFNSIRSKLNASDVSEAISKAIDLRIL
jgi:DNA-binding CsgD family transcriptional regulator